MTDVEMVSSVREIKNMCIKQYKEHKSCNQCVFHKVVRGVSECCLGSLPYRWDVPDDENETNADISSCRIIARTTQELVIIGAGIDEETHGAILLRKHVETLKCFCENCKKRVESDYKYCPFCGDIFSSVYVAKDANDQFEKLYGRKKSE